MLDFIFSGGVYSYNPHKHGEDIQVSPKPQLGNKVATHILTTIVFEKELC